MGRAVVAVFLAAALLVSLGGMAFRAPDFALGDGDLLSVPPAAPTVVDSEAKEDRRPSKLFSWDQVDPSKKATCGFNKCFFRHRNGKDGYLVGLVRHEEDMAMGYERAMMLERYGLGHYYYREYPPERVRVSKAMHELGQGLHQASIKEWKFYRYIAVNVFTDLLNATDTGGMLMAEEGTARDDDYTLDVVRVRQATYPRLEWGDNPNRQDLCSTQFGKFHAAVLNRTASSERMHAEIRLLSDAMETERWMQKDFQVIIERTGRINHIDLDRNPKEVLYENFQERRLFYVIHLEMIADAIRKESYDSDDDPCSLDTDSWERIIENRGIE